MVWLCAPLGGPLGRPGADGQKGMATLQGAAPDAKLLCDQGSHRSVEDLPAGAAPPGELPTNGKGATGGSAAAFWGADAGAVLHPDP